MPGSAYYPTSHPSYVSFAGVQIGSLTGWRATGGTAQFEDTTNITNQVIGSGTNARLVRSYDCTAVEPGSVEVNLLGCPPYLTTDLGTRGLLEVVFTDGSISLDAYLESFEVTAAVGEVLVGNARFRFSGIAEE